MTMPQLDTVGFGLLKDDDESTQKAFCSGEAEPLSAPSPPPPPAPPSYIMKNFTIDYTDVLILIAILIILRAAVLSH